MRKKVVCFNNIVSFGLTTNRPKEAKGMACDVFFATDYHGLSRCVRAVPCHCVAIIILLVVFCIGVSRIFTDVVSVVPCHSVAMTLFVCCFLHRSFTDIHGCFPCDSVSQAIALDVGCNRIYTAHPCASVKFRCYEIKGAWTWTK